MANSHLLATMPADLCLPYDFQLRMAGKIPIYTTYRDDDADVRHPVLLRGSTVLLEGQDSRHLTINGDEAWYGMMETGMHRKPTRLVCVNRYGHREYFPLHYDHLKSLKIWQGAVHSLWQRHDDSY